MTKRVIKKPRKSHAVRAIPLGQGLPNLTALQSELQDMVDVLLGRTEPPKNFGTLTLMETADAYYARAAEITMMLQQKEREGTIIRGSGHYKFRTGELRTFMEMAKHAADLGSRRLTQEQVLFEMERYGRESL